MGGKKMGVGWVVTTAITKNRNNTNGRVEIGYDVHMYITMGHLCTDSGRISGQHCHIRALH